MASNDPKMDGYNILYLNCGHNVTLNYDYILTWFNDYLPYICNCIMGFVSNCVKAFRLQMVVQAPTSATASSNYYLGPLDQRSSI